MYPPGLKPSPVKSAACITLQEPIQTTRFYSTRSYGGQSRCTNNSKASWLQPKEAEPGSSSWLSLPKVKPARPKTRNQPYKPTRPAWLKEDECVSESESQVSFSSAVTHLSDVTSEIKVKERKDLIHQLDLFDKEKCEGEINAYFGDGYKNKQYHRYSDMTYLNLVGHLKKYRQKQPGDNWKEGFTCITASCLIYLYNKLCDSKTGFYFYFTIYCFSFRITFKCWRSIIICYSVIEYCSKINVAWHLFVSNNYWKFCLLL